MVHVDTLRGRPNSRPERDGKPIRVRRLRVSGRAFHHRPGLTPATAGAAVHLLRRRWRRLAGADDP